MSSEIVYCVILLALLSQTTSGNIPPNDQVRYYLKQKDITDRAKLSFFDQIHNTYDEWKNEHLVDNARLLSIGSTIAIGRVLRWLGENIANKDFGLTDITRHASQAFTSGSYSADRLRKISSLSSVDPHAMVNAVENSLLDYEAFRSRSDSESDLALVLIKLIIEEHLSPISSQELMIELDRLFGEYMKEKSLVKKLRMSLV
uniref:Uncharacterized protein n=1 Tax=Lepeophtheirus salmonis TaxID=72036 RepID=A0A0K2SX47_LEPSM